MGKRHRNRQDERTAESTRVRLERLLAAGDTRGAVDAAKLLLRDQPGAESASLAVRAYVERIRALIAEGLGREAGAMAAIVRERFPAHLASCASVLEDARLAAGDFDWLLRQLAAAESVQRAAIEERLTAWITDPSVLARSPALDPADPLAREAAAVAEVFEIVTGRLASPDEMARLNDIRRRSPLAPWKLLLRAIEAFHRNEDDRVAANVAAVDSRSPAARAGAVLSELIAGRGHGKRSFAAERLIDRISGGRATIATQLRSIEAAANSDDRKRLRDETRAFTRSFDKLSAYAREQVRMTLLAVCGSFFEPEQVASLFRIDPNDPAMPRYAAMLMEINGMPFAAAIWIAYAKDALDMGEIEPWQAGEIYLHALDLGDADDPFVCRDPTHGHPVDESPDTAALVEEILGLHPAPAVVARLVPYLDRLEKKELRRVLTAWRKRDPSAPQPLVRLLRLADREGKDAEALALVRQGDGMKILDPEFASLRLRVLYRNAEQLLVSGKRASAAALLEEIERSTGTSGDAGIWLLALQWAAASPEKAGNLLTELAGLGVAGEMAVAEITGALGMPYALTASHSSAEELLEGVRRGIALLSAAGRMPRYAAWIVERTQTYLDRANDAQLMAIGSIALTLGMIPLAWKATAEAIGRGGTNLHRALLLRAEIRLEIRTDPRHTLLVIEAAQALAEKAHDIEIIGRAAELGHELRFYGMHDGTISQAEIDSIVDHERASPLPRPRGETRRKTRRKKAPAKKKSSPPPAVEKGLFEP
jgi:hypothetical protein